LMSLKDGIPKQWGQYYLKKLIDGDPDPLLENWNTFEQGFLSNWTDPASVQVAERRLRALNQFGTGVRYGVPRHCQRTRAGGERSHVGVPPRAQKGRQNRAD
jgi:hypothetical protein